MNLTFHHGNQPEMDTDAFFLYLVQNKVYYSTQKILYDHHRRTMPSVLELLLERHREDFQRWQAEYKTRGTT